ncbi:hypothetical protein ACFFIS_09310 [Virgibacillus soli]|uniref:hypothetical protein n=1 Tax=Paracerasibacillus soli TaxID=480284 RepID=UPI0035E91376
MRKWSVVFIVLLSVVFVSACNNDHDELSGKTFKIAYKPVLEEDMDNPSRYTSIMTLKFSKGNIVHDTNDDIEGTYELNEDILVVNLDNKSEKLKISFIDFKESEKDFSAYSALISNPELQSPDSGQVSKLTGLAYNLTENMPLEFIIE